MRRGDANLDSLRRLGMKTIRTCRNLFLMLGLTGLLGCAIATDLVNPDLIRGLGLDTNIISPSQGTVIVVFENSTSVTAGMCVAEYPTADPNSLQTACQTVDPGTTKNYVFQCPITTIIPGIGTTAADPNATSAGTGAATVVNGTSATDINYTGSPLNSGVEFHCGDVIQITLVQTSTTSGTTSTTSYAIQVQVLHS